MWVKIRVQYITYAVVKFRKEVKLILLNNTIYTVEEFQQAVLE
jgi:hypothetical protein